MARWFLRNPGFELGNKHWAAGAGWAIGEDVPTARTGNWRAAFTGVAPNSISNVSHDAAFPARPGLKYSAEGYINGAAATAGQCQVVIRFSDASLNFISVATGNLVPFDSGYTLSAVNNAVAPARAKWVTFRFSVTGSPNGTPWYVDDLQASGDVIEQIPASAIINSHRWLDARTVGEFDPLIGSKKYTDFNAGMSDKWAGLYTFVPALGTDLDELVAFIRRLGKTERFFAFHPDRRTPRGGVVNGLVVDGAVGMGSTRIPVRGGAPDTTPLGVRDFVEIGAQYFEVQRPLEIGPQGTGELIVWPSVRAALVDGEDVITDNPKMVARITSDLDERQAEAHPVELTFSWEEAA